MNTPSSAQSGFKVFTPSTWKIVQALFSTCPACQSFNYGVSYHKAGLPCLCCDKPTERTQSIMYSCRNCDYQFEQFYPDGETKEDLLFCNSCTPGW